MKEFGSKKKEVFELEYGPVELVDMDEINTIYPGKDKTVFIEFRRLTQQEIAKGAGNNLDDMALVKKLVKGWGGYAMDGKEVDYKPKYLEYLEYQTIDWILECAFGDKTVQAELLTGTIFRLNRLTKIQRMSLQAQSQKGFRSKRAGERSQKQLLQATVTGWEGVYYKGKEIAYSPDLVELLPWNVVAAIMEARPDDVDEEAREAELKN